MLAKTFFMDYAKRKISMESFIRAYFPNESYSTIELERTPLGIKIVIYTDRPGKLIGSGGRKINELTDMLKTRFKLENPQVDVKGIRNPDMDAKIVAKRITSALERGYNYKKIGNIMMKRVMDAGAVGCEIVIAGKLGGSKSRTGKFVEGYLKHCGQPAIDLVDAGFEEATTRPGKIGVKVKIMRDIPRVYQMKENVDIETLMPKKKAKAHKEKAEEPKEGDLKPEGETEKETHKKAGKPAKKAVKKVENAEEKHKEGKKTEESHRKIDIEEKHKKAAEKEVHAEHKGETPAKHAHVEKKEE